MYDCEFAPAMATLSLYHWMPVALSESMIWLLPAQIVSEVADEL